MPFVQRVVQPVYLSRQSLQGEDGEALVTDYELEAVTNNTLSGALRQLASLVLIANDIFDDLTKQLQDVCERSRNLRARIDVVENKVSSFDPRKVTVPEGDLCAFSQHTVHFKARHEFTSGLFSAASRPDAVRLLYETAAKTPVHVMRQLDRYRRDGHRSSRYFLCTPVLGARNRRLRCKSDIDIETRKPAVLDEMRRWTSSEAFGDVTVGPDCTARIAGPPAEEAETSVVADGTDHRLPSPEEQVQAVALRFPSEVISVDVTGRVFDRMSLFRRSLLHVEIDDSGSVRRRGRSKKTRSKRRNTIAGTDQRELQRAITGDTAQGAVINLTDGAVGLDSVTVVRSASSDLLGTKNGDTTPPDGKKSHFSSLKQWGKIKLKMIRSVSNDSGNKTTIYAEEANIYETIAAKCKKADLKHERKTSSVKSSTSLPISAASGPISMAVKLRENSLLRRQKRDGVGKEDAIHSSSGNWSASSESGRASIASENTATTHQPKSTTTLSSAGTSSNSLNHHQAPSSSVSSRRKFLNTSTSSSFSEGTLTPDIMSDLAAPFADDGETSSIYSCDTEGYYTSFHVDSGLKTLKEEDISQPQTPLHSSTALSNSPSRSTTLTAESEYELFGKGSTSTTTSSAGTVCTTLMIGNESNLSLPLAPAVPERKSSLDQKIVNSQMVVAMIHKPGESDPMSESPDSGHNTSSSPVDSTCSPQGTLTGRSSEYEFSESDLEGVDRIERIRMKTTINSSRIPSMCVITPPQSDDETSLSQFVPLYSTATTRTSVPSTSCKVGKNDLQLPENALESKCIKMGIFGISHDAFTSQGHNDYHMPPRKLEKQVSTDSDKSSEKEVPKTYTTGSSRASNSKRSALSKLDRTPGYTLVKKDEDSRKCETHTSTPAHTIVSKPATKLSPTQQLKSSLQPFNSMFGKVKEVLTSATVKKSQEAKSTVANTNCATVPENRTPVDPIDAGDYVTIADVYKNKVLHQYSTSSHYTTDNVRPKDSTMTRETEYVSLNELPVPDLSAAANVLLSQSDSLERRRRQGARVTLDSEGKVVYSSDSLRRLKGAHTTFEPGPYIKDPIVTPNLSPLPTHRVPKSNIRPVTLLNHGQNLPQGASAAMPVSNKPLSPTSTARLQASPTRSKRMSPMSPHLGKVIIRASAKTPPTSPTGRPMSPRQTANSARGAYVNVQSPDDIHRQRCISPGRSTPSTSPTEDEEANRPPPKYVSPPPTRQSTWTTSSQRLSWLQANSTAQYADPQTYWTLPARSPHQPSRPSLCSTAVGYGQARTDYYKQGGGRYNTIASSGSHSHPRPNTQLGANVSHVYTHRSPDFSAYGANNSSHDYKTATTGLGQNSIKPVEGKVTTHYSHVPCRSHNPTPVTIPTVPRNNVMYQSAQQSGNRYLQYDQCDSNKIQDKFYSSTPTKNDQKGNYASALDLSATFSPIQQYLGEAEQQVVSPSKFSENKGSRNILLKNSHLQQKPMYYDRNREYARETQPPNTLLKPTMTSEEIFAAIHKTKKHLNIKTDSDGYPHSGSPSCSSATSISPGSSESSVCEGKSGPLSKPYVETGSLVDDTNSRIRHSWSPNSGEYYDFYNRFERRTPSPSASPGSRQSWACDRLGPKQQTSRNDFKRLLLQQSAKSYPNNASLGGKLSAVEQLRLSRQQKDSINKVNGTNTGYFTRSPAEKRSNGSKLLQSPRTAAMWKFASPRTDVLSSTILEDCAEEEKASISSQNHKILQSHPKLPATTAGSHGYTSNTSVRRPLNLYFERNTQVTCNQDSVRQSSPKQQNSQEVSASRDSTAVGLFIDRPPSSSDNYVGQNTTQVRNVARNFPASTEMLSPTSVKENVNVNQQVNKPFSQPDKISVQPTTVGSDFSTFKSRQLAGPTINQHKTLPTPSPRINALLAKQHVQYSHRMPPRSILGTIDSKSPSKTLETAL